MTKLFMRGTVLFGALALAPAAAIADDDYREKAGEKADKSADQVKSWGHDAQKAGEKARGRASDTADDTGDKAKDTSDKAQDKYDEARDKYDR